MTEDILAKGQTSSVTAFGHRLTLRLVARVLLGKAVLVRHTLLELIGITSWKGLRLWSMTWRHIAIRILRRINSGVHGWRCSVASDVSQTVTTGVQLSRGRNRDATRGLI
jgi:hypothetical protein